jgi:hypothetical protein
MLLLWGPKSIRLTTPKANSHPGLLTLMVAHFPGRFRQKEQVISQDDARQAKKLAEDLESFASAYQQEKTMMYVGNHPMLSLIEGDVQRFRRMASMLRRGEVRRAKVFVKGLEEWIRYIMPAEIVSWIDEHG